MPAKADPSAAVRARAYKLADSGHYADWASLSADLVDEGAPEAAVRLLTHDSLFQIMLKSRISSVLGR
jgi:hypothetical protein